MHNELLGQNVVFRFVFMKDVWKLRKKGIVFVGFSWGLAQLLERPFVWDSYAVLIGQMD